MSYGSVSEIIAGFGKLFVRPTASDTAPITGNEIWDLENDADWEQLGYTQDGIQLEVATEEEDTEVDQEDGPVQSTIASQTGTVTTKLAQTTLKKMSRLIPGSTYTEAAVAGTNPNKLTGGGGTSAFMSLACTGKAPDTGKETLYYFSRVKPSAALQLALQKGKTHQVPATFKAFSNNAKSAGERLFEFYEETSA